MDTKRKNVTPLVRVILSFVLAAVLLISLFLPVFSVGTVDVQLSDGYYEGALTKYAIPVGKVDVGLFTVIEIIKNYNDIRTIVEFQLLESNMSYFYNEALELYSTMSESKSDEENAAIKAEVDELMAEFGEKTEKYESASAAIDETKHTQLTASLGEEEFVRALVLSYRIADDYNRLFVEYDRSEQKTDMVLRVSAAVELLAIAAFLIALPLWIVALTVIFIIRLISFLLGMKKNGAEGLQTSNIRFPFLAPALTFLSLLFVWGTFSSLEVSIGLGLMITFAVCIVAAISESVFRALPSKKKLNDCLFGVAITLIVLFLLAFFVSRLIGLDVIEGLKKSAEAFSQAYAQNGASDSEVGKANLVTIVTVFSFVAVIMAFAVYCFGYFVEQVSTEGKKRDDAKHAVSRAGLVLCAVALVISFVPSVFGTTSLDSRNAKFADGKYKVLWNAHEISGTDAYTEFYSYYSLRDGCIGAIANLPEQIELAEESERPALEAQYNDMKVYLEIIDMKYDRVSFDQNSAAGVAIASAAALLVVQFIYCFIIHDDRKLKLAELEEQACAAESEPAVCEIDAVDAESSPVPEDETAEDESEAVEDNSEE